MSEGRGGQGFLFAFGFTLLIAALYYTWYLVARYIIGIPPFPLVSETSTFMAAVATRVVGLVAFLPAAYLGVFEAQAATDTPTQASPIARGIGRFALVFSIVLGLSILGLLAWGTSKARGESALGLVFLLFNLIPTWFEFMLIGALSVYLRHRIGAAGLLRGTLSLALLGGLLHLLRATDPVHGICLPNDMACGQRKAMETGDASRCKGDWMCVGLAAAQALRPDLCEKASFPGNCYLEYAKRTRQPEYCAKRMWMQEHCCADVFAASGAKNSGPGRYYDLSARERKMCGSPSDAASLPVTPRPPPAPLAWKGEALMSDNGVIQIGRRMIVEAIPGILQTMETVSKDRRPDAHRLALRLLTGQDFAYDIAQWRAWTEANRAQVEKRAEEVRKLDEELDPARLFAGKPLPWLKGSRNVFYAITIDEWRDVLKRIFSEPFRPDDPRRVEDYSITFNVNLRSLSIPGVSRRQRWILPEPEYLDRKEITGGIIPDWEFENCWAQPTDSLYDRARRIRLRGGAYFHDLRTSAGTVRLVELETFKECKLVE